MALGKKSKSSTFISIRVNGEDICNKKELADELNHHFSTIAKRVFEKFPSSLSGDINLNFENNITNMPKPSKKFYFKKMTPQAVTKAISQLKNSKSGTIQVSKECFCCYCIPFIRNILPITGYRYVSR